MPNRTFGGAGRYGFNGKERDKDMHSLTAYDYGFRIYNPAIGKFLSVDPLTQSYPWYTPYQFAGNMPIWAIDLDGAEPRTVTAKPSSTKPALSTTMRVNSNGQLVNGGRPLISPNNPPQGHPYISTYRNDVRGGWDQVGPNGGTTFIPDTKPPEAPAPPLTEEQKREGQFQIDVINYQKKVTRSLYEEEVNPIYNIKIDLNVQANSLQILTDDPSTLSDQYLEEVDKRIKNGSANFNDYKYQDEIAKRKRDGKMGNNEILLKPTFTKLNTSQIEKLKTKFGNGDPKYIEKLKTGSGDGAGKYDLYKDDKTGEIIIKPKSNPNAEGEKTKINIKDID